MRDVAPSTVVARRLARLAGAVALAGLAAACSSSSDRFGTITGSTGTSANTATANSANTATANNDSVYSSPVPPASNGTSTYSSNGSSSSSYSSNDYASAPASSDTSNAAASSGANQSGRTVTVSTGQTLYSIARENGVSVQDLVSANGLAPPYHLKAGQKIAIPSSSSSGRSYASGQSQQVRAEAASADAASGQSLASNGGTHTVRPGETLYSLGRAYSVSPGQIASLNGFGTSHQLKVGEKVRIPGHGGSDRASSAPEGKAGTDNKVASASQTATATDATAGESGKSDRASGSGTTQASVNAPSTTGNASLPTPEQRSASNFRWPVKGRVISQYGPKPNGSRNDGINISVPNGTGVRAAENGVVAYAGNELKGYGNLVLVRHSDGWVTAYAHNEELLVSRGDTVKRGDIIAKAGQTGSVTSPQLHFEIRKGAQAVDPMQHLSSANLAGN